MAPDEVKVARGFAKAPQNGSNRVATPSSGCNARISDVAVVPLARDPSAMEFCLNKLTNDGQGGYHCVPSSADRRTLGPKFRFIWAGRRWMTGQMTIGNAQNYQRKTLTTSELYRPAVTGMRVMVQIVGWLQLWRLNAFFGANRTTDVHK